MKLQAMKYRLFFVIVLTFGSATPGLADDYYQWQEKLRMLDKKCEDARAARLAPIRERLAKECEKEPRRSSNAKEECAIETSTYGNNSRGARGAVIRGQFYDLPECFEAANAHRESEASQQSWWKN